MIALTDTDQTRAIVFTAVICVVGVWWLVGVWWQQEQRQSRLEADLDEVWAWCRALHACLFPAAEGDAAEDEAVTEPLPVQRPTPGPRPADTVVAHPAATSVRKQALLHRGEHRASDGGKTVAEIRAEIG